MKGVLPALPGEMPTIKDWEDHMTTAFPEVRLKQYLEMRGADGGPWGNLCALPAFWVGSSMTIKPWPRQKPILLTGQLTKWRCFETRFPKKPFRRPFGMAVCEVAIDVLEIAKGGLRRRARLDHSGNDETSFLNPLTEIARTGVCPAETLLASFNGEWGGKVEPAFEALIY